MREDYFVGSVWRFGMVLGDWVQGCSETSSSSECVGRF